VAKFRLAYNLTGSLTLVRYAQLRERITVTGVPYIHLEQLCRCELKGLIESLRGKCLMLICGQAKSQNRRNDQDVTTSVDNVSSDFPEDIKS
jgi:hypothetical protein